MDRELKADAKRFKYGGVEAQEGYFGVEEGKPIPESTPSTGVNTLTRWTAAALLSVAFTAVVLHLNVTGPQYAERMRESTQSGAKNGWLLYKAAWALANNTALGRKGYGGDQTENPYSFLGEVAGGTACSVTPLGCEAFKYSCAFETVIGTAGELHFVVAPEFFSHAVDRDGLGVEGWQRMKMEAWGEMENFATFMHDKVQLFHTDIQVKLNELQDQGFKTMLRRSRSHMDHHVGHVLVPFGGVIFEFYGELKCSEEDAENMGFKKWAEDECPKAHIIKDTVKNLTQDIKTDGSPTSIITSISTSVASFSETALSDLKDVTNAHIVRDDDDLCSVVSVSFKNEDEREAIDADQQIEWRQVLNTKYQSLANGFTIADYQNYIDRVHDRYLTQPADKDPDAKWRSWDHWLDTHVGFMYNYPEGAIFETEKVDKAILANKIPTARRAINKDGDHYYAGYPQMPMTIEYNVATYHHGNGESNVCGCVAENSARLCAELNKTIVLQDDHFD